MRLALCFKVVSLCLILNGCTNLQEHNRMPEKNVDPSAQECAYYTCTGDIKFNICPYPLPEDKEWIEDYFSKKRGLNPEDCIETPELGFEEGARS